jgi:hypothetical protein
LLSPSTDYYVCLTPSSDSSSILHGALYPSIEFWRFSLDTRSRPLDRGASYPLGARIVRALHHSGWCTDSSTALTSCLYQHHLLLTRLLETTIRPMLINGISHGYFDLDAHFTTLTDSLPIDLRLLPCTITHFQSDNGSGYMVMGCTIGHEIPYTVELDFPIQSPYTLHSCGPWHSYNILSDDGSHELSFAAAPPFAFIKPRLLSTNKRFWFANPPHFF